MSLNALKDHGVRLAIDDFGTGGSSLTYLRRYPFDELKIDQAFVAGLGQSAADDAIVAATIDMAHALGMMRRRRRRGDRRATAPPHRAGLRPRPGLLPRATEGADRASPQAREATAGIAPYDQIHAAGSKRGTRSTHVAARQDEGNGAEGRRQDEGSRQHAVRRSSKSASSRSKISDLKEELGGLVYGAEDRAHRPRTPTPRSTASSARSRRPRTSSPRRLRPTPPTPPRRPPRPRLTGATAPRPRRCSE